MKPKNGKAKSGSKSYGKESKPRKARAPKPTVEAATDAQRQAKHFQHVKDYERDLVLKKNADARLKATEEKIKREGGAVKMIKLAVALKTDDGENAFQTRIAQEAEVARWHGVAVQLDLFGKQKKTVAEVHFEDGKRSALNDEARKPPDHLSQRDAQHWMNGHDEGRKSLNVERAAGFKPLAEVVNDLVPPAPKVPPATDAFPAAESNGDGHQVAA